MWFLIGMRKMRMRRLRGEWRVAATLPESISAVHSHSTRYSKCVTFSVCVYLQNCLWLPTTAFFYSHHSPVNTARDTFSPAANIAGSSICIFKRDILFWWTYRSVRIVTVNNTNSFLYLCVVYYQQKCRLSDFHEILYKMSYKQFSRHREFHNDRLSDRHTLLMVVNTFLSLSVTFLTDWTNVGIENLQ